jgi:hypothetical protein
MRVLPFNLAASAAYSLPPTRLSFVKRLEQNVDANFALPFQRPQFTAVATKIHPSSAEMQDAKAALQSEVKTAASCFFEAMPFTPVTVFPNSRSNRDE